MAEYISEKRKKFGDFMIEREMTGKPHMADAYIKAGYKASTRRVARANAHQLKKHPEVEKRVMSFKKKLNKLDDTILLDELMAMAQGTDDKRAKLKAIDTLLKLKDRFPGQKLKVAQYAEELSEFE